MNVLFLVRTYAMGGSSTMALMLMEEMQRLGFRVFTAVYEAPSGADQQFVEVARARGLDVVPERIPWRHKLDWMGALGQIGTLIKKYRIDLIHTHDNQSNVLVGMGRIRWPCAILASAYGWWEPRTAWKLRTYYEIERRFALPRFDRVYTVSDDLRQKIVQAGTRNERVRVIHTGIVPQVFAPRGRRSQLRSRFGIPDDAIVAGMVSRLSPEKGHRVLLRALYAQGAALSRMHLLIVGTGPDRPGLESAVASLDLVPRVHFTGFHDDLGEAFESMDIYVLPSVLPEGLPTSALEAQAAGLPILASDIGGTREAMYDGVTGYLFPPGDEAALANRLRELTFDEDRRRAMAVAALRYIKTLFSRDRMLCEMADLYSETYRLRASG